jgi:hypothetical protein
VFLASPELRSVNAVRYCSKLYSRHLYSFNEESWLRARDVCLAQAEEFVRAELIFARNDLQVKLRTALLSKRCDADNGAIADVIRFASATSRLCLVPFMTIQGFLSEALVHPDQLSLLADLRVIIGEHLDTVGWLTSNTLCDIAPAVWKRSEEDSWARTALAHAAAWGLGELTSDGLFYRRPFPDRFS